jgi:hypothetical protein
VFVLFTSYDVSIHHDINAVLDSLGAAVTALEVRVRCACAFVVRCCVWSVCAQRAANWLWWQPDAAVPAHTSRVSTGR